FKIAQIQIFDTSYEKRAKATAVDNYTVYPSRGLIYDRNGKLLINNNPMYDLRVIFNQLNPKMDTLKLCGLLEIGMDEFRSRITKNFSDVRYSKRVPFTFMSKISSITYARLQEHLHEFSGFSTQLRNVRSYPHHSAPHVLGYLNEVNQKQIDKSEGAYEKFDYIGASGLELSYEKELRGEKGFRNVLKDNLGREVGPYQNGAQDKPAISGSDIYTSLDIRLQEYGEKLMQNKVGSIVAIEPGTGEILAMISTPSYDPNLLTINRGRGQAYNQLHQDTLKPFFDRSVMAQYPPGSIFKTVVALVAMQEGLLEVNRRITCNAGYYYNGKRRGCHPHASCNDVANALQTSCNAYFFTVMREIIDKEGFYKPHAGLDLFDEYLKTFGLGSPLNVDIPNEEKGNIPTSAYYDLLYPKSDGSWKSPTIMSIGIGQGEIEMTTLQMANLAAIMANRGYYYPPHLIKQFSNSDTSIPDIYKTKKQTPIDPVHFVPVVAGMHQAVEFGTGRMARIPDMEVCGKTGTSENSHGKDHSVFFAFAPKENPKIAIAVYVENGGWGSNYGAPMAGLMIEQYLRGAIAPSKVAIEDHIIKSNLVDPPNL
ncbi:MAG: penicillin-binding protein 2, partial [Saprospiraceae bacterium]